MADLVPDSPELRARQRLIEEAAAVKAGFAQVGRSLDTSEALKRALSYFASNTRSGAARTKGRNSGQGRTSTTKPTGRRNMKPNDPEKDADERFMHEARKRGWDIKDE